MSRKSLVLVLAMLISVCGARASAGSALASSSGPSEPAYLREAHRTRHAIRHIKTVKALAGFLQHAFHGQAHAVMLVMADVASLPGAKAQCVSKALALSSQSPIPASSPAPSYAVEFHSPTAKRDYYKAKRYLNLLYLHRTANSFHNFKTAYHRPPVALATALPYLAQSASVDAGFSRAEIRKLLSPCQAYSPK